MTDITLTCILNWEHDIPESSSAGMCGGVSVQSHTFCQEPHHCSKLGTKLLNPRRKKLYLYYRKFQCPKLVLFKSYIGPYLPSGERLHVVEINIQWWRYARALYSIAPNTMVKPLTKIPHGQEQHHVNANMLGHLREQAKWPTGAQLRLPLEFCIFV